MSAAHRHISLACASLYGVQTTERCNVHLQAFRLHQQLSEAIHRRDEWREKDKETPQKERERLLEQVKADNQEIASIEKR